MNRPIPSQSASSEVERNNTLVFSGGCSESALAIASCATQPVPLSLAPGTTSPAPMCAMNAAAPAETNVPRPVSERLPSSAPAATSAGPPTTGHISGGLVSFCSKTQGALSPTASVIAGLKKKAVWAASWCAIRTIVRSASGGPSSPSTWWQLLFGSSRRNRRRPGGSSSALRADAAAPVAAANSRAARPPRRAARPARAAAPASRPIDHQKVPLASGSSSTRTARTPSSRRAPASHSAARSSPSEADSRSKAQSSSRRSRIQAASGGVETLVGTSVAIRENYESSSTGGSFPGEPAPAT